MTRKRINQGGRKNRTVGTIIGVLLLLWVGTVGCRLTTPLTRRVEPLGLSQRKGTQPKDAIYFDSSKVEKHITFKDKEGNEHLIIPNKTITSADGEELLSFDLQTVTVTARSKTVPERLGKIDVSFIVTIPKPLLDRRWQVIIRPQVLRGDTIQPLDDIRVDGDLYRRVVESGHKQLSLMQGRYKMFNRDDRRITDFIRFRYNIKENHGVRLDTVTERTDAFAYFYTQEIEVAGEAQKSIRLRLGGQVEAIDRSRFDLPLSDTLTYYISSVAQFVDRTDRYRKRVITRKAEANYSADVLFTPGKDQVIDTLGNNRAEIDRIKGIIREINFTGEFIIDSVLMIASGSPEGSMRLNDALTRRRAENLTRYFKHSMEDADGIDTIFRTRYVPENWELLGTLVRADDSLRSKETILNLWGIADPDEREYALRRQYPNEYAYIRDRYYPLLRKVDFRFCLHRRGMIQDTVITTEIDTEYAHGVRLIEQRRYKEALSVLEEYDDYNTAICFMSLGYDLKALDILRDQPVNGDTEYVRAILYARTGDDRSAVAAFLKACELDDSKAWRGALDPEINRLITQYDLKTVNPDLE